MGTATVDYTGVADTGNILMDSLTWGSKWVSAGTTTITVGYFPTVDTINRFGTVTGSRALSVTEIQAITNTIAEYEKYIDVDFVFMGADATEQSDIQIIIANDARADYLGEAFPPGEQGYDPDGNPGFSEVFVYSNSYAGRNGALAKGGYDFVTFIHEFGHAMGLAHPHDDGGTSNPDGSALDWSEIFPGVPYNDPFDNYGDFGLNQGIFTTMSYNDGWPDVVRNGAPGFGYQAGLMALDIMALQYIYGANTTYANGDENYALPTKNAVGTGYVCIYDTGGTDTIAFGGNGACVIDLRAATGQAEEGGGGFVSYGKGVKGGFTIAIGTIIENATGSKGADKIIGNAAANVITGNGGKDTMTGGANADIFFYGALKDTSVAAASADIITDFTAGEDKFNLSTLDYDLRTLGIQLFSDFIDENLFTAAGQIRSQYDALRDRTLIQFNTDLDQMAEAHIVLKGNVDLTDADFIFV